MTGNITKNTPKIIDDFHAKVPTTDTAVWQEIRNYQQQINIHLSNSDFHFTD